MRRAVGLGVAQHHADAAMVESPQWPTRGHQLFPARAQHGAGAPQSRLQSIGERRG